MVKNTNTPQTTQTNQPPPRLPDSVTEGNSKLPTYQNPPPPPPKKTD